MQISYLKYFDVFVRSQLSCYVPVPSVLHLCTVTLVGTEEVSVIDESIMYGAEM